MKKKNLICFIFASLLLTGCTRSTLSINPKNSGGIPSGNNSNNNNNNNTGNNGSGNGSNSGDNNGNHNDIYIVPTYQVAGSVGLSKVCRFWDDLPTPFIQTDKQIKIGTEFVYIADIQYKDIRFDANVTSDVWTLFKSGFNTHYKPGNYVLMGYYKDTDGKEYCTNKIEFTIEKGIIDGYSFRISNSTHNHVISCPKFNKTLGDMNNALSGYDVYYTEDDKVTYEASFEYEGKVTFKNTNGSPEIGKHMYDLVFTDDEGLFEPFTDTVELEMQPYTVDPEEVSFVISQGDWSVTVPYSEGSYELPFNAEPYEVSLGEGANSELYSISQNLEILNCGDYFYSVSLGTDGLYHWKNNTGLMYNRNIEFTITIAQTPIDIPVSAYFKEADEGEFNQSNRLLDGKKCELYASHYGDFCLKKRNDAGDELNSPDLDCEVEIVSDPDNCLSKGKSHLIYGVQPGKAIVNVVSPKNGLSFNNVEITVLLYIEPLVFQSADYSCSQGRTHSYVSGATYFEDLGVGTNTGSQSSFYFNPNGAVKAEIHYAVQNISPRDYQNYATFMLKDKENETFICSSTIPNGSNRKYQNLRSDIEIPFYNRNQDLLIVVNHSSSSDSDPIYVKEVYLYYK